MSVSPGQSRSLGERIEALDSSLFDQISTQLALEDQRSLLALHSGCRQAYEQFTWLEVGSAFGGALQSVVRDPRCVGIISIDPRPASPLADERGYSWIYPENSTARMISGLGALEGAEVAKIVSLEAGTGDLSPHELPATPHLCFIDGEHTDRSALRDARFCRAAMRDAGCIVFHDAQIVYRAISSFIDELSEEGAVFRPYLLPNTVMVIELGELRLLETPQVTESVLDSYRGYLYSLEANDVYRQFFNRAVFRLPRKWRARLRWALRDVLTRQSGDS
jgi:hypothetical protein